MVNRLKAAGVEDAELAVQFLAEDGCLCEATINQLCEGVPLQYLVREWEFYGLPMKMRPGVLIARPDTEILVDTAIDFLKTRTAPVFADLGCGSGAITLAVMKHTKAEGYAIDKNPEAVALTKENAARNDLHPTVIEADLFGYESVLPSVDAILSNPPYLDRQEMGELSTQVQKEPETALFGGEDGLDFYRYIAPRYRRCLKEGGALIFEIGYRQAEAVRGICADAGYHDIEIRKDYGGNNRVVFCRR